MRKNRFRNKIKSMFGSYIQPEKDEELKGSYIEMEEKYKKIIEILKDEDMDDRKKVVEMIEDFHKHHQSVYERYDHITGELKEKFHSKIEKDSSSSSSSDSDSNDTFTKKGRKNGKLKVRDILKEQLQAANTEIDVLTAKMKVLTEEKEALSSDYQAVLRKEQENEKMFEELKLEADRLHEENSKILADNKDLNLKFENFESLSSQKTEIEIRKEEEIKNLTEKVRNLQEEMESLNGQKSKLEEEIASLRTQKLESESELEKSSQKISGFLIQIDSLKQELVGKMADEQLELQLESLNNLKNESETQIEKKVFEISELGILTQSLKEELESKSKEQEKMVEEKEGYESKVKDLELKLESLDNLKKELESQIEKKSNEISEILITSQSSKEELESKVKDLELRLESLNNLKNETELQLEKKGFEIFELVSLGQSLKEELESKSKDQEKTLEEKEVFELKVKDLEIKLEFLENLKNESKMQLESEKQDYLQLQNQLKDKIEELKTTIGEKEQTIEKLEESIEDLKGDLENKSDDVTTLTETVRNLEVKIRLTNQKLRVTEQTLTEKEDNHTGKQEKLHQENKSLVLKISTLSEIITRYKESEETVKKEITQKINDISGAMDSLTVMFEEDHRHILTQIYEIMNEIHVTKIAIKNLSFEKAGLKEQVLKMMIQLKGLETEKVKLTNSVDRLETLIHVKDERLLDLGEEKREAIRQLCMLIDYQRDRYDRLRELRLRKTTDGRR